MLNNEIKGAIKAAGLKQWEVAERYPLSEGSFCRLLRREPSQEKKAHIMAIIAELQSELAGVAQ